MPPVEPAPAWSAWRSRPASSRSSPDGSLEAVTIGLPETDIVGEVDAAAALDELLDLDHDAAVIGPGLRPGLSTVDLVLDFLAAEGERAPVVVDAEGLNSLSTVEAWWERVARPCVLTPHVGELTRLMAAAKDRFEAIPPRPLER